MGKFKQNMQNRIVSDGVTDVEGRGMFGLSKTVAEKKGSPPPPGIAEIIFCVLDEKHRVHHLLRFEDNDRPDSEYFRFLNEPEKSVGNGIVGQAIATRKPATLSLAYGDNMQKSLHILPYERKRGKWRFACLQLCGERAEKEESNKAHHTCLLSEDRFFLVLCDAGRQIRSASGRIPEGFGYSPDNLTGMNLSDLFSPVDLNIIESCSADAHESIQSCSCFCLDGSRRDVEVRKYSAPDNFTLYAVCDVTAPKPTEELSQIAPRERRRIGQDLHDSIGQLLTGISLLSRSLANSLKRGEHSGELDAAQISALADDASNQIRKISRGLMPSEIVEKGLFDSLRELARITTNSCGLLCVARIDETVRVADSAVETHLYRIAQEAVNNAVRHAHASRIDIVVTQINGLPQLEVTDNGTWKETLSNLNGLGMKTMEYRASAIGAQFRAGAHEEGGTRVVCLLEAEDLTATRA
jgi:signal transduction histidine kinase